MSGATLIAAHKLGCARSAARPRRARARQLSRTPRNHQRPRSLGWPDHDQPTRWRTYESRPNGRMRSTGFSAIGPAPPSEPAQTRVSPRAQAPRVPFSRDACASRRRYFDDDDVARKVEVDVRVLRVIPSRARAADELDLGRAVHPPAVVLSERQLLALDADRGLVEQIEVDRDVTPEVEGAALDAETTLAICAVSAAWSAGSG